MTAALPLTERDFMRQVTELAELFGWQWAHFRPAMTTKGWRTAVSGPLGKGWPDLVLVRERDRRLIFAELKRDSTYPTPEQRAVMDVLRAVAGTISAFDDPMTDGYIETWIWRPRDFDEIERCLR